jgi:site-specific recombinase XerD
MTRKTKKRHATRVRFKDPAIKPITKWLSANQGFYDSFRHWLREGGYGDSALNVYSVAARLALGFLDKAYWMIDPDADIDRVREYIATHYESEGTRSSYLKGICKFEEYLRFRCHRPKPQKRVNWGYHLGPLPDWLADDVRAYIAHCRRAWMPEQHYQATSDLISHLTLFLRWAAANITLTDIGDLTPALWFDYVDERLAAGIKPVSINGELRNLRSFLHFLADQGRPVCQRALRIEILKEGSCLPRDVPPDQLRRLLDQIEADASSSPAGIRRMGVMDWAWCLLMLHSGLRTGEVHRLRLADLDLETRRARIEQSKGLKDRIVCLSRVTVKALRAYLEIRGPATSDHVFLYRHQPLSESYCGQRLRTYSERCGVRVTPHQLRFSCATLLLNAGAPILMVQTTLGHKFLDTTLRYARLYDGTVAAEYYSAMAGIEHRLGLSESTGDLPLSSGQLLALVDRLRDGTLNEKQRETVQTLRKGILALVEQAANVI